ncbi:MAG: antibiotic biosynthesis monooxygenase [Okeania sp. SIO2G4]|uniref:putative quinol monooxygenase n=1 Tax=unclassified Okeania TaxID=2634635 RepID=UPI0013BCA97D|nr:MULTISPECIES: putative quinol monooxygenase [unclassified Okeania]NEP03488.1 antibiotic biosynthesis monooxygenase [Okeania sp. SIO4D6]NEP37894.1 antibiotic biosynthesis monooxygenase [Okeania sp. SIO2H7]NEP71516.1 antibiotic biosynthesis monooxygenase [Okeania sp. SIO2G5]NEP92803.1 antibiotic biosynthesis monooxygenase [Okeania sp. SIO2F5]NEQ90271.1 antibiotic biosynthesis monooxygenase [Okeania sp. SIO2G4]
MSEKLYTVAVLKAQKGKFDELVAVLEELARETRQEVGSLQYGFYTDKKDPNTILSFEEWEDTDVESAHWETLHLTSAVEKFKDILDGEPIVYKSHQII